MALHFWLLFFLIALNSSFIGSQTLIVPHQIFRTQLEDHLQHPFQANLDQFQVSIILVSGHIILNFCSFMSYNVDGVKAFFPDIFKGLHNIHGSFNLPNMPGSLAQRNAAMSGLPSSGVQQPGGSISGRFTSNNLPVAMSQVLMLTFIYVVVPFLILWSATQHTHSC